MEPFVVIAALVGILGAIAGWKLLVKIKKEDDERNSREQLALEMRNHEMIAKSERQIKLFSKYITKVNVLSRSVWIGEEYKNLIASIRDVCRSNRLEIGIFDFDYDAIISSTKNSAYGDPERMRLTTALNRLAILEKLNVLQIVPTASQSKAGPSRDSQIVDILAQPSKKWENFTFFTEDKSLNARVHECISDNRRPYWHILNAEDHLEASSIIAEGLNEFTALWRLDRKISKESPPSS